MYFKLRKTNKDSSQHFNSRSIYLFWFVFFILFIILINLNSNGDLVYKYDNIFDELDLTEKFESKNHTFYSINLQLTLRDKNFSLFHRVDGFKANLKKTSYQNKPFFYVKSENFFKIGQNNSKQDFVFKLRKLKTSQSDISCYNVTIDYEKDSKVNSETCFELDGYWFGGHESYGQPYWPINSQNFDYVPYVTG